MFSWSTSITLAVISLKWAKGGTSVGLKDLWIFGGHLYKCYPWTGPVAQNLLSMVTLQSMVTTMETHDFNLLLSPVTMVIAIDGKVTINGKLYATGPQSITKIITYLKMPACTVARTIFVPLLSLQHCKCL